MIVNTWRAEGQSQRNSDSIVSFGNFATSIFSSCPVAQRSLAVVIRKAEMETKSLAGQRMGIEKLDFLREQSPSKILIL